MKPVIIQVPSSKDGKVTLTIKELQDMLDKAYESGKQDGTVHYGYCPYKPWSYTYTTSTGTGNDLNLPNYVTCSQNSDVCLNNTNGATTCSL